MYNLESRDKYLREFSERVEGRIDFLKCYCDLYAEMAKDNVVVVKSFISMVNTEISKVTPKELSVAPASVYTQFSGEDGISLIKLTLRNKYSDKRHFSMKREFARTTSVFDEVVDFFRCSYIELITDALVRSNLEVVNSVLGKICEGANNSFRVTVVPPMGNLGKSLLKITDDEVVYVASEDRALSLDDILVFSTPTEFVKEELIEKGINKEISLFAQAQTSPQFVGLKSPLIGYICDIGKLIKPITLIKKAYSRNALKVTGNKETLAYYTEDGVYSVVRLGKDIKEVVLQPFNTESLERVDLDVLSKI